MMTDSHSNIRIETLPNGYTLTIDDQEYMYMNAEDLIAGFFTHVAIGKTEYLDKEMVEGIMLAAATWQTVGKALEANASLIASARMAQSAEKAAEKAQWNANAKAAKAEEERKRLYRENLELQADIVRLQKKIDDMKGMLKPERKSRVVLDNPENTSRGRQYLITGRKGKGRYARKD